MTKSNKSKPDSITPAVVATYPWPGLSIPGSFKFSPDDNLLAFLKSGDASLERELVGIDLKTGEQISLVNAGRHGVYDDNVSLETALRRERQRQRETGVTSFEWAEQGRRILIPLDNGIYLYDHDDSSFKRLVPSGDHPIIDAQFSPDGMRVAYVQDNELYLISITGGQPIQLTHGARGTGKTHGLAEYIAQEEMNRMHGYWWSPDSKWLAFTEVDETHIPIFPIMHLGKDEVGKEAYEDHRYPFAGKENAKVRLGVVSVDGGEPLWMDTGPSEDIYLARIAWLPDGYLSVQIQNRSQDVLDLLLFEPVSGKKRLLLRERSETWINLHDMFRSLQKIRSDGGAFIWASERDGFRHLYLLDSDGNIMRQLTAGEWVVDEIAGIDEDQGIVYFLANREGPTETHLYSISLGAGDIRRVTFEAGIHSVALDHGCRRYVDIHQSMNHPPTVRIRSLADSTVEQTIFDWLDPRIAGHNLTPPELATLRNRQGDLMYALIYRPPAHFGEGPYPTLVNVYGGPHAQLVTDSWGVTANMRSQFLSRQGYLVFVLDNRGSARRGHAFESAIKDDMGRLEVEDQVDGVAWLVEHGLSDPERIGIYGWSYGGYMACMCMARAPEIFKAAVAGAPVTGWDGYDTHYTERYMGTPESNPEGYRRSSVLQHVDNIQGHLLLVHGMIDENVHFRHTVRLIKALIDAGKPYELLVFPDARHGPRSKADRTYLEERILDFFKRTL